MKNMIIFISWRIIIILIVYFENFNPISNTRVKYLE